MVRLSASCAYHSTHSSQKDKIKRGRNTAADWIWLIAVLALVARAEQTVKPMMGIKSVDNNISVSGLGVTSQNFKMTRMSNRREEESVWGKMNLIQYYVKKTYFALSVVAIKWDEQEVQHTAKVLDAETHEEALEKGYAWARDQWAEAEGWSLAVSANEIRLTPPLIDPAAMDQG